MAETSQQVTDPVCGMSVDPTALKADYQDTTYYFCSPGCQSSFQADPAKYATATTA